MSKRRECERERGIPGEKRRRIDPERGASTEEDGETAGQKLSAWLKENEGRATALKASHPVPRFDDCIEFDEKRHVYSVNGLEYRHSATSFLMSFFEEFPEQATIERIVESDRWHNDPSYRYYRMPADVIERRWEKIRTDASRLGTETHAYIEHFYNDTPLPPGLDAGVLGEEYRQFHRFHEEHVKGKLKRFRTELRAFDAEFELAGSVDMLYKRAGAEEGDMRLVMYDWKRSKEIHEKAFKRDDVGREPAHTLPNCKKSHFLLQPNVYKFLIERGTDYRIDEMYVACFHPNHKDYLLIPVPNLQETVGAMCELRRRALVKRDAIALEKGLSELAATPLGEVDPTLLRNLKKKSTRLREKLCPDSGTPEDPLGAPASDEE